jgi:cell wall-associated NlpC family hydrolase
MRKIWYSAIPLLAASTLSLQAAIDCRLQINITQNDPGKIVLIVNHDAHCEVIIEQNLSRITILEANASTAQREERGNTPLTDTGGSGTIEKLITLAKSKLGNSYAPTKAGPDHFDCSGFVYYLFKSNGVTIPRSSLEQSRSGQKLTRSEIKRGDILFFDTYDRKHINHSGVYLGEGKFIHSSSGKAYGVTISELDKGYYKDKFRWGIRKIEK